MKKIFLLLLGSSLFMASCGDGNKENETTEGHEQLETPVTNSGAETERDRALQSIEQDTTHKEISVGRDSSSENE